MWRSSSAPKSGSSSDKRRIESASPIRKPTLSPRSTLTEILKQSSLRTNTKEQQQPRPARIDPIDALNRDLIHIASVYPDVQIDVLRELLLRFDGKSRLQVCVEQLFRHKSEWARGRLVNPPRDTEIDLPEKELFRTKEYTDPCRRILSAEFKALSKSAIDAVLAEVNHSYIRARPILQEIAAKTWRATIANFFRKKKVIEAPPVFLVGRDRNGRPVVLSTGSQELDNEVEKLFVVTPSQDHLEKQSQADYELANQLNYQQAEELGALFECQCCFDDVPFEQISTCVAEGHVLCIECVRRTFNEALFGQSWTRSVDDQLATLQCFAPLASDQCHSHIHQESLKHAITLTKSGHETWSKFEQRLANDTLGKSGIPLQTCPFCPYGEAKELHTIQSASNIHWRWKLDKSISTTLAVLILFLLQYLILAILVFSFLFAFGSRIYSTTAFRQSLVNLSHRRQTQKFKCQSQNCGKSSCTVCHKQWHDPHVCHEPLILSLRSAVEAARTAALKRVCPRCGMGFVKSSGCNKLVCLCGYAMCYLCRKNIGRAPPDTNGPARNRNINIGMIGRNQVQPGDEEQELAAAGEGYQHFCPHFRPLPGQKCIECDKCDLYKSEDEDAIIRQAGEVAEREWRAKYEKDVNYQPGRRLEHALAGISDDHHNSAWFFSKRVGRNMWKLLCDIWHGKLDRQGAIDWLVERMLVVVDEKG